jgi:signal transduction histidine kinase
MSMKTKSDLEREQLLRDNAKLRGDLLTIGGRVRHDLLTPLGSILISIQLLKETLPDNDPSVALAMDSLSSSVDEIKQLVESVGMLAKATALPLPKEKVAMGAIVSEMLKELKSRISKSGATVSAPDSWPQIEGVPGWLEFVWRSFLANALQNGGLKIQLGWIQEKKEFRFWVSDNGTGVPAETNAQIFQTFDSLHGLDSAHGLGLSIVQRLVELQGGICGYQPAPGGACFYFTLPTK